MLFEPIDIQLLVVIDMMAEYTCEETESTLVDIKLIRAKSLNPKWKNSPEFIMPELLIKYSEQNKKFEVLSDDIWLTCHLKTGSTWAQEMIWLLNNDLDFKAAKVPFHAKRCFYYE